MGEMYPLSPKLSGSILPSVVVNVIEYPRLTARERLLALQRRQFTPAVERLAEVLLEELRDDHSPEIEAMRIVIGDAVEQTRGIRSREDRERRANESSVMSALRYRAACRACGRNAGA